MRWSFITDGNYINFRHTDETDLHIQQTIHRLHNTSRCIDWSLPADTTRITFTIDESKYENVSIYDVDFDGVVMDSQDDFETGVTAMFTGLAGGGSSSYLVYAAILNQVGTDNPTVIVLENTIGPIVWTRGALGQYDGTLAGAFTVGKTIMPPFVPNNGIVYIMLGGATADQYNYSTIINDVNSVTVLVGKTDFSGFVDLSTIGTDLFIEIRVYS